MRLALVTTTINVPEVLCLYRTFGPDVEMFVAMDDKTPFMDTVALCSEIGAQVFQPDSDDRTWKCSRLIGRGTIGRRSIAILEALKQGADVIVTIDDDNIPLDCLYFNEFKEILMPGFGFSGMQVGVPNQWLDYGRWLSPPAVQRGVPQPSAYHFPNESVSFVTGAKVGVAQGICLGDPDTSAIDRISRQPDVHQVSQLLHAGVVVHPGARTVSNTQNTAFVRELAPCFLMVPQFGRHDDIYASLICRRVMRETGHYLHLGKPFCWQQRNQHDLLTDLRAEMWGMENIIRFTEWLDAFDLSGSVLDIVRHIYRNVTDFAWMPEGVCELGTAWCDDCESVL